MEEKVEEYFKCTKCMAIYELLNGLVKIVSVDEMKTDKSSPFTCPECLKKAKKNNSFISTGPYSPPTYPQYGI